MAVESTQRSSLSSERPPFRLARLRLPLLTFLVVVVYGGFHFRDELVSPALQSDIAGYVRAFDRVEAGGDPYAERGYLYTPVFAVGGNALYRWIGAERFVLAFRVGLLLGVWLLVWMSLRAVRWPAVAVLGASALVVWSGLLDNGIHCANATPLLAGPLAVALVLAERRPWLGGLLAGSINAWKPLGVTALAVTATPGTPERGWRPQRWQLAFGLTALASLALWLPIGREHLHRMLSRTRGLPDDLHHLSVHRALYQLGIHVPATVVFLLVTALGCAIARAWVIRHEQRVALALAFSAMAVPVVNPNTLLLTLPLQALALDRAVARWRSGAASPTLRAAQLALVAAAAVGIHGALGTVAIHGLRGALGGLVTLIPHAEVLFLALYAVVRRRSDAAPADRPLVPV